MRTQETGASVRGEGKSSHHKHHDQTEELQGNRLENERNVANTRGSESGVRTYRPKEAHLDHTVGVLVRQAAGDELQQYRSTGNRWRLAEHLLNFAVERASQKNVDEPCNAEDDEW